MDKQKVFNKVARHLLRQGKKSISGRSEPWIDQGSCLYRGPKGLRCAIGALIPNKLYSPDWEGLPIWDLPKSILKHLGAKTSKDYQTGDIKFLSHLQAIHDEVEPAGWFGALSDFAKDHFLKMPDVKET